MTTNWRISCGEPALERGDPFLDRSGAGAHLEDSSREEAATGEGAAREVVEERVAHRDELRETGRRGQGRFDDLGLEDASRFVDGRELQVLLRTEVRVDAALAHVEGRGEVPDRQAFEAVDGGEGDGLVDDGVPGPFAVGALLAFPNHVDKIARSVVLLSQSKHERSYFLREAR